MHSNLRSLKASRFGCSPRPVVRLVALALVVEDPLSLLCGCLLAQPALRPANDDDKQAAARSSHSSSPFLSRSLSLTWWYSQGQTWNQSPIAAAISPYLLAPRPNRSEEPLCIDLKVHSKDLDGLHQSTHCATAAIQWFPRYISAARSRCGPHRWPHSAHPATRRPQSPAGSVAFCHV